MIYHLSVSQEHWWRGRSWSGLNRWMYFVRWSFSLFSRCSLTSGVSELSRDWAAVSVKLPMPLELAPSESQEGIAGGKLGREALGQMPDSSSVCSVAACPSNWTLDSAESHRSDTSANWARHRSNLLTTLSLWFNRAKTLESFSVGLPTVWKFRHSP